MPSDPQTTDPHEITAEDWSGYLRATANSLRQNGDPSYVGLNASELEQAADEMDRLRIRVMRLEGYSDGLCQTLTNVRRAAGCSHD